MAGIIEIQGANQLCVRAYRHAARIISGLGRNVADMLNEGKDLTELRGIGEDLARRIEVARPFGRLVGIASAHADFSTGYGTNLTVHLVFLQREQSRLVRLIELIRRGQLKPVVDSVMPVIEVAKAHRRRHAGGVEAKIVLQVGEM